MTEEEEANTFFFEWKALNECQDKKEIHTLPWRISAADLLLIKNKVCPLDISIIRFDCAKWDPLP